MCAVGQNSITGAKTIFVDVDDGYDVVLSSDLDGLLPYLDDLIGARKAIVVTDSVVKRIHACSLVEHLEAMGHRVNIVDFESGEQSKNFEVLRDILEQLAELGTDRHDCVIALGGGVCGDLSGLASHLYMRGIDVIHMPTTIIAATDASIGGKCAIDGSASKNLIGAFNQPKAVLCNLDYLNTLTERELRCGIGEVAKTALLAGGRLYDIVASTGFNSHIEEAIELCIRYKSMIVNMDPLDRGQRRILNLGHTFGHAIESLSGYEISHGECVSIGIAMICGVSLEAGWMDESICEEILCLLDSCGLPTECQYGHDEILSKIRKDKKVSGDAITLAIPSNIGSCELREVSLAQLSSLLKKAL